MTGRLLEAAARPVNAASAAIVRIAFGAFMVLDMGLYLPLLVTKYYVDTTFTFPYDPWNLVQPLPGAFSMHLVYLVTAVFGAMIALGWHYRAACAGFFVLQLYVFLIDSTNFQNHEYLITLLGFAFIFLPLHRQWSLDARRRPEVAGLTVPAWVVWFLRFQFGLVYFFGGVAKLNADWLAGEPLRMWLHNRTHVELVGRFFTNEGVVWFANYGSLVLDLTVVGFLLHRRTRVPAFVIATIFHLINARLFGLFVFPWLMIAATTIFFDPEWPLKVRSWWARRQGDLEAAHRAEVAAMVGAHATTIGGSGAAEAAAGAGRDVADGATAGGSGGGGEPDADATDPTPDLQAEPGTWDGTGAAGPNGVRRLLPGVAVALAVWMLIQVLVPLRHLAIPGDPNWTEEGHRFAWHMMLRTKSGSVTFHVVDGDHTFQVDPADHLNEKQTLRLPGHPERLARFAQHLSDLHDGAEVYAETSVALNGREPAPIVDPNVDLSQVQVPWWGAADWILPLEVPLRRDD
jgi:vitamin K-dependent gamma-carboxylase